MRFFFDDKALQGHPCVSKVDRFKLVLNTDLRVQMYKVWRENQSPSVIAQMLQTNGLGPELVGPDYHMTLASAFRMNGFPFYYRAEIALKPDYKEENPLLLSGRFIRADKGNGIVMEPLFMKEVEAKYPEISIEENLRVAGLDPVDVGYQRIKRLEKIFEDRQKKLPELQKEAFLNLKQKDEDAEGFMYEDKKQTEISRHPYVKSFSNYSIVMKENFFNEAYLLFSLGLEKLFEIYEIDTAMISERSKTAVGSKLYHWTPVVCEDMDFSSEQVRRIWVARINAMQALITEQFRMIGERFVEAPTEKKRNVCKGIAQLPRDTSGYYTTKRILGLTGISKSTYYALLHDENYGTSEKRKQCRDEEDIEVIRQVVAYKGFEKGIRQVYMLLPKLTGQYFSIYRIRRLMNKYGIRTTIRRPSRNRKAMKELIARNKKANLLMRRFRMHRPNEVRLTDVTYLDYGDDLRAYGSATIDPVTGRLVCFVISENNDLKLAMDTLEAMDAYPAKSGGILHSDQGILYMTDDFQAAVVERELNQSMSRRGNCWDNAPQESFFGHFKDECGYKECRTLEELRSKVDEYSVYYNHERGMWDKQRMTPVEFEKYLTEMDEVQFAAYLAEEEERYLEMKEKSAQRAVQSAKEYKEFTEEQLEGLGDETGKSHKEV